MQRLQCPVQTYAWGKLGLDSSVAGLKAAADPAFPVQPNQTYAELWVGTHANGPSLLAASGTPLARHLADNPAAVGDKLAPKLKEKFATEDGLGLPFLFKVLSVQKALSVQVHPTKAQAEALHAADPANYKDPNHKPEMAIALSPFELLCGFRPPQEILHHIRSTPELFELVGGPAFVLLEKVVKDGTDPGADEAKAALKTCFSSLMGQPSVLVEKNVTSLLERQALVQLHDSQKDSSMEFLGELLIRLNYAFPGDVGILAPFFLNHFKLEVGEAVFLGPNEPHAYLYGDCVECMANSDNVIRAGLTPKFKDVTALLSHLTYRMAAADANKFLPSVDPANPLVTVYDPPTAEFVVHRIASAEPTTLLLPRLPVCSVAIVTEGPKDGDFRKGSVLFIPAGHEASLQGPATLYRAFTDEKDIPNLKAGE